MESNIKELLKSIEEYGKLENELGKELGKNEVLLFGCTDEVLELRNKRTEKFIEINKMIIKLSERLLVDGE